MNSKSCHRFPNKDAFGFFRISTIPSQLTNLPAEAVLHSQGVRSTEMTGRRETTLVNALAEFESLNIAFVSLSDNVDLSTPSGGDVSEQRSTAQGYRLLQSK